MGNLVYGDNDYDVLGQERGAYFGRWEIIRRGGQEKGGYFGRLGDDVHGLRDLVYWAG